ncbi:hypothetical protein VPHD342_0217 [Vibrio phage D342]
MYARSLTQATQTTQGKGLALALPLSAHSEPHRSTYYA